MILKNHTYYFGKVPEEYNDSEVPEGWEPNYYFRFRVLPEFDEQINFEDTCNRMVPFDFQNLCEMRDTLERIIRDISIASVGADYNEVS